MRNDFLLIFARKETWYLGILGGSHLYLSRAEKQRMYSVIQRSSTTISCERLIFSRSADRARRRSSLELRLSDSLRVWTQASEVWLCEEKPERGVISQSYTGVLLFMLAACSVTRFTSLLSCEWGRAAGPLHYQGRAEKEKVCYVFFLVSKSVSWDIMVFKILKTVKLLIVILKSC